MPQVRFASVICVGLLLLGACAQNQGDDTSGNSGAESMYYQLIMDSILQSQLGFADNNASYRAGEDNPYRNIGGSKHKALAACLVWDHGALEVSYRSWNAWVGNDWSGTKFIALKNCRTAKRQKQSSCACQVIDHDDENVLEVPAEFLAKHNERFGSTVQ